jgi:hypothetical protein
MAMGCSISENVSRDASLPALIAPLQTALATKEFDRLVFEMGGRHTNPGQSRLFRETITHTNAKKCTITCGNVIPFRGPYTPQRVVSGEPPDNGRRFGKTFKI